MTDVYNFGLSYLPRHSRRLLGMDVKGAVDQDRFDDIILGQLTMMELAAWLDAMPPKKVGRMCLSYCDKVLPDIVVTDFWKVRDYLSRHGPSTILAIAQVEAITWKRRLGVPDTEDYIALIRAMDAGKTYTDAVKELVECEA